MFLPAVLSRKCPSEDVLHQPVPLPRGGEEGSLHPLVLSPFDSDTSWCPALPTAPCHTLGGIERTCLESMASWILCHTGVECFPTVDKAIVPPLSHDTGIMLALRKEEASWQNPRE